MGQSLTKIAYPDGNNNLKLSIIQTKNNFEKIFEFLDAKKGAYKTFNFTGGRTYKLFQKFSRELDSNLITEFQANVSGVESLYLLSKHEELPPALIVTIGTGTSIILKKETFRHIGGSALGGGLFMGLIKLLFNINSFQEAISIAKKGNRYNIDLKVADIYDPEDNRINLIFREFTASSFGKIEEDYEINSVQKEDVINAIIHIIGENIGSISTLMAENNDIDNIVYCGGFLTGNNIVRKILTILCRLKQKKAVFLKHSEFSGAIGALFGAP